MVAAPVLGTGLARGGGSSPLLGTRKTAWQFFNAHSHLQDGWRGLENLGDVLALQNQQGVPTRSGQVFSWAL